MSAPRVSVVVGVYNGGRYLERSLASVLSQTGVDFELVVVDDGSSDGSGEALDALAARDPRVRVLHQENRGLTRALIRGCAEARGALIARHDADDLSRSGRLARLAARLDSDRSLSMASSWSEYLGPEEEVLFELRRTEDAAAATERLLTGIEGPPGHGSVMFRRDVYERVGGYRPEFYFAQDVDLWTRLAENGRMHYEPEFLYAYRVSEQTISTRYRDVQVRLAELSQRCRLARRDGGSEAEILAEVATLRPVPGGRKVPDAGAYFIGRCLMSRRDPRARRYLRRALRQRPWNLKAWVSLIDALRLGPVSTRGAGS